MKFDFTFQLQKSQSIAEKDLHIIFPCYFFFLWADHWGDSIKLQVNSFKVYCDSSSRTNKTTTLNNNTIPDKIPKIHLNAKAEKANNHIAFILDLETSWLSTLIELKL